MIALAFTTLTMSALILVVWIVFRFFPHLFPARIRYLTWVILLIGLVIPIRPSLGGAIIDIPIQEFIAPIEAMPIAVEPAAQTFNPTPIIWFVGTLGILGYHLVRYLKFVRQIKRWGQWESETSTLLIFERIKQDMGLERKKIRLMNCPLVASSMLTGFFRPIVLLPEKAFDDEELTLIFRHELVHYKRKDLPIKLLSLIAIAVHWFNPLVYLLSASLQAEGETSCDEAVLKQANMDERHFYAEVIISMIGKKKEQTYLATNFYGGKAGIKKRLSSLLDTRPKAKRLAFSMLTTVLILTLGAGSVFAADHLRNTSSQNHDDIKDIALSLIGGGVVNIIESQHDVDVKRFTVTVIHEEQLFILEMDAETGEVLSLHSEAYTPPDIQNSESAVESLTAEQAVQIARSQVPGSTLIEFDREPSAWYIALALGNHVHEFYIHLETGEILSHETYEN